MSIRKINNTIVDHLRSIPELPQLILENEPGYLDSTLGTSSRNLVYCRATFQPIEKFNFTVGEHGQDKLGGFVQVDLFYPNGTSTQGAWSMVDIITEHFPEREFLPVPDEEFKIHIMNVFADQASQNTNYYMVPLIIEWQCFIGR